MYITVILNTSASWFWRDLRILYNLCIHFGETFRIYEVCGESAPDRTRRALYAFVRPLAARVNKKMN